MDAVCPLPLTCRNLQMVSKPGYVLLPWEESGGYPVYCPGGIRHIGSMNPIEALLWNV
jgi:hypothetical protein